MGARILPRKYHSLWQQTPPTWAIDMLRFAITDRTLFGAHETQRRAGLLACTSRWAEAGIDFIQLREKDLSPQQLITLCSEIQTLLTSTGSKTRLLLNVPAELALTDSILNAHIDGIHLPSTTDPHQISELRTLFQHRTSVPVEAPQPEFISISCHTLAEVDAASANGVDLILFGPVFGKQVAGRSIHDGVCLEALQAACTTAGTTPVLALGGITHQNTAACVAAGAAGIAAIRLFAQLPTQPAIQS